MNETTNNPNTTPFYLTDKKGKRVAVVVPLRHYKRLLQVHKRLNQLEKQATAYQDIDSAMAELRSLLSDAQAAQPADELLELLREAQP